jgi:hypothetical protein
MCCRRKEGKGRGRGRGRKGKGGRKEGAASTWYPILYLYYIQ